MNKGNFLFYFFILFLLVPALGFGQVTKPEPPKKQPVETDKSKTPGEKPLPTTELLKIINEALKQQEALKAKQATPEQKRKQEKAESKIIYEIDGLLIDETLTKTGHDFYDLFYSNWEAPAKLSDYTIRIKERPLRGRGFQIVIVVNDNEVIEENLQPRYDMLEDAAINAVQYITGYLKNFGNIREQLENDDQKGTGLF